MVFKRCKFGRNTGNTIRKYEQTGTKYLGVPAVCTVTQTGDEEAWHRYYDDLCNIFSGYNGEYLVQIIENIRELVAGQTDRYGSDSFSLDKSDNWVWCERLLYAIEDARYSDRWKYTERRDNSFDLIPWAVNFKLEDGKDLPPYLLQYLWPVETINADLGGTEKTQKVKTPPRKKSVGYQRPTRLRRPPSGIVYEDESSDSDEEPVKVKKAAHNHGQWGDGKFRGYQRPHLYSRSMSKDVDEDENCEPLEKLGITVTVAREQNYVCQPDSDDFGLPKLKRRKERVKHSYAFKKDVSDWFDRDSARFYSKICKSQPANVGYYTSKDFRFVEEALVNEERGKDAGSLNVLGSHSRSRAYESVPSRSPYIPPGLSQKDKEKRINKWKKEKEDLFKKNKIISTEPKMKKPSRIKEKRTVELWEFIEAVLNKDDKPVQISSCKKKCSVKNVVVDSVMTVNNPQPSKDNIKKKKKRRKPDKSGLKSNSICSEDSTTKVLSHKEFKHKVLKLKDIPVSPLLVKIKMATTRTSNLVTKFGGMYKESLSLRRKFWIDISDSVADFVKGRGSHGHLLAVLLFEEVECGSEEGLLDNDGPYTYMWLTIKTDLIATSQRTLYKMMENRIRAHLIYPVSKLVEYYTQAYRSLPDSNSFVPVLSLAESNTEASESVQSQLDWLYAYTDWKYDILNKQEAVATFLNSASGLDSRPTTAALTAMRVNNLSPGTVLVCHSCNVTQSLPLVGSAVVLHCKHAFCYNCLNTYLLKAVESGSSELKCPEPMCSAVIDPVTALSITTLLLYNYCHLKAQEKRLEEHPLWKICPNETCGRAAKLNGSGILQGSVIIQCKCGDTWCFQCSSEGHWPATCQQYKTYAQYLNEVPQGQVFSLLKGMCAPCRNRDRHIQGDQNTSDPLESCKCPYRVCQACINLPNTPLQLPKILMETKEITMDSCIHILRILYYRSALNHRTARSQYNPSYVRDLVQLLMNTMQKSKPWLLSELNIKTTDNGTMVPHPPSTPKSETGLPHRLPSSTFRLPQRFPTQSRLPSSLKIPGKEPTILSGKASNKILTPLKAIHPITAESNSTFNPNLEAEKRRITYGNVRPVKSLPNAISSKSSGDSYMVPVKASRQRLTSALMPGGDRFFINMAVQLLQQGHFLLEFVYVSLCANTTSNDKTDVLYSVLRLEKELHAINELLHNPQQTNTLLPSLYRHVDEGKKIIPDIIAYFRRGTGNGISKSKTVNFGKFNNDVSFGRSPFAIRSLTK